MVINQFTMCLKHFVMVIVGPQVFASLEQMLIHPWDQARVSVCICPVICPLVLNNKTSRPLMLHIHQVPGYPICRLRLMHMLY